MKLPATGFAADFRARLGEAKIRLPLKADETAPGYVIDAEGKRILGLNPKAVDLDAAGLLALARTIAGAVNWNAGIEVR